MVASSDTLINPGADLMALALRARVGPGERSAMDYRKRPMQIIRLEFGIAIRSGSTTGRFEHMST